MDWQAVDQVFMVLRALGYHVFAFSMLGMGVIHPRFRATFFGLGSLMLVTLISFDLELAWPEYAETFKMVAGWVNTVLIYCILACTVPKLVRAFLDPYQERRRRQQANMERAMDQILRYLDERHSGNI